MITTQDCFNKYGEPSSSNKNLTLWDVPTELEIGVIPKRIYCNKDMVVPLTTAFKNLIDRGFVNELKTWDGCFNVRVIRGYEKKYERLKAEGRIVEANQLMSIHSWGTAIDVNAFENGLGVYPKLTSGFVKCFTDAGFDWGGAWKRLDGMHFQLAHI
jgi:hypothetical protein